MLNENNPDNDYHNDISSRFLLPVLNLRAIHLKLHNSFLEIINQHAYPKVISSLLGEALVCNTLATNLIKFNGRVVMNIQNKNSPLKLLSCICNDQQEISGLVQWNSYETETQLTDSTLSGNLVITIIQQEKEPYQSITSLDGNSITETICHYFNQSEQLPSKVFFTQSDPKHLQGLLLQYVPENVNSKQQNENKSAQCSNLLKSLDCKTIQELLKTKHDSSELLANIFPNQTISHQKDMQVKFKCSCNRKRMINALVNMGQKECQSILNQYQVITVKCEFCGIDQNFDQQQVDSIWN